MPPFSRFVCIGAKFISSEGWDIFDPCSLKRDSSGCGNNVMKINTSYKIVPEAHPDEI